LVDAPLSEIFGIGFGIGENTFMLFSLALKEVSLMFDR